MKIYSPNEANDILKAAAESVGLNMTALVNRVGEAAAKEVIQRWAPELHLIVFAGWGVNGAYALATASCLIDAGYSPDIYLFNIGGNRISAECLNAKKLLMRAHPECYMHEITKSFSPLELDDKCLVIDGLFGTELDRTLPMSFGMLIRSISESGAAIVSIGLPSGLFHGWNTHNNASARDVMHASLTLAIGIPTLAYFMAENIPLIGEWKVLDVGLTDVLQHSVETEYFLITPDDIHRKLRPRETQSSKADFGNAMICAGSYGMMGAAVLATKGCLRAGVGKVTCHSPRSGYVVVQTSVPCALFEADPHEKYISKIVPAHSYNAIAIGPGIGTTEGTINALEAFLKMSNAKRQPLVIDADALNCIACKPIMMNYIPALSVLTPHVGEFDRIFGAQPSAEARMRKALEIAAYHNIVMVIKGHYTQVIRPDGIVYINTSGTPALATPGSGDVLTGVITALIAQGYAPEIAALIGVYVHGRAGEIAENTHGSYGVTADDVANCIGRAIKSLMD